MNAMIAAGLPDPAALLAQDAITVVARARWRSEPLLPAEARYLAARAVRPRRAAEFHAGRACARRALSRLGWRDWPLLPAPTREPQWPDGVVGSITHSEDYCAVAVAGARRYAGLGIDVETIARVGPGIAASICTRRELEDIAADAGRDLPLAAWFSAKESVFKAVFPWLRLVFEPSDVEIAFDRRRQAFAVRAPRMPRLDAACSQLEGRFALSGARVLTAAWLERSRLHRRQGVAATTAMDS